MPVSKSENEFLQLELLNIKIEFRSSRYVYHQSSFWLPQLLAVKEFTSKLTLHTSIIRTIRPPVLRLLNPLKVRIMLSEHGDWTCEPVNSTIS